MSEPVEKLATGGLIDPDRLPVIGHGGCLLRDRSGRHVAAFIPDVAAARAIAAQLEEPATEVMP